MPTSLDEPLGRLDDALEKAIKADMVDKKLRHAVAEGLIPKTDIDTQIANGLKENIITEEETDYINQANAARSEVIKVDDFSKEELKGKTSQESK
jgi:acyl-CoA dehydrogenase